MGQGSFFCLGKSSRLYFLHFYYVYFNVKNLIPREKKESCTEMSAVIRYNYKFSFERKKFRDDCPADFQEQSLSLCSNSLAKQVKFCRSKKIMLMSCFSNQFHNQNLMAVFYYG